MEATPTRCTLGAAATLAAELDLSVTGFWRLTKKPGFPQPIRLGPRCTRFDRAAVLEWVNAHGAGKPKNVGQVQSTSPKGSAEGSR